MNWAGTAVTSWWRSHVNARILIVLLLGQVVSLLSALASLCTSLIAKLGVDAPLTQTVFTYALLASIYASIILYRRQKPLISWYWYFLLSFADVQGNYLVNKAYEYSSITSVTMLNCSAIPWVIILTWIFMGTRYTLWQLIGAVICVVGLCVVLVSDTGSGGSKPILGDVFVIAGVLFYGMSNVAVEFCAKRKDRVEVLCMLGVYGVLITIVQASIIELKTLESIKWSAELVIALIGYALSCFVLYTFYPYVLKLGGAAIYNLSTLTVNIWAVIFKVFIYHQKVSWLYYLSFAIIIVGLIIYSTTGIDSATEDENQDTEYQVLNDESTASGNNSSTS